MEVFGERRAVFSLLASVGLVVALAATAYVGGEILARRWMTPPLALPALIPTAEPRSTPAARLSPGQPVEGNLGVEAVDEWAFAAAAGQSATIEMWFHPGSGSSVDAELMVRLFDPTGKTMAERQGSVFLPPYVLLPSLPSAGSYRVQVLAVSGAPGRYSLGVTLSTDIAQGAAETTPVGPTKSVADDSGVAGTSPFQWPSERRAISGWTFHDPRNPGHIGLDIAAEMWDPIVAAAAGEVAFAEWGGGYGNLVVLEHDEGWSSYYAHLTEIAVAEGQAVRQGETLGGAGTTGYSTGPHLHFELRYRGRPVDPHVHLP